VPLGILAAVKQGSWIDHLCRVVATAGVSLPVFFTGLLLVYIFYFKLGWSPAPIGRLDAFATAPRDITGFYLIDSLLTGNFETFRSSLGQLILPATTLAVFSLAPIARMTVSYTHLLHDLTGLADQKPVHALLGGKIRDRMALLGVIAGGDFDGDLRDTEKKKAAGVTAYKIKVGIDSADKDAARTRAVCKLLKPKGSGGDMLISADANQGFTTEQAIAYVRGVQDCGLDFFEQPVEAHDLAGMAAVAAVDANLSLIHI